MSSSRQIVQDILNNNYSNNQRRLVSLPLQFGDLPVDILAKQFTKLNSPHLHRIHYLGPRFVNTQHLHKKYAYAETHSQCQSALQRNIDRYHLDYKKIVTSFSVNQRLRSNHHYKTGVYYRAFQGMNPSLDPKKQFVFDSSFQSGNLDCVIQYRPKQFDCFLRIDSNTRGHAQWFYFSIKNGEYKQKIKINICNISKPGTLYEQGMHPYIFSKKKYNEQKIGWKQGDHNLKNVVFQQKDYNYSVLEGKIPNKVPYCLSFEYQFQNQNDEVFFAYCIPYTYSELLYDINTLSQKYCKIVNFSKSLSGVNIPMLIIGNEEKQQAQNQKKNIFITSRIHPGQTNGSHMVKGFLEYLCSQQRNAKNLRKRVNFFIIPMINPDGVILGNTRSSVAGKDLNRVFPSPNQEIYPQVYQLKNIISCFSKYKKILMYFDFHGHSRRKNTFFYGPAYSLTHPNYYKARILPKIIESLNCTFRFHSCSFGISESKKTTGRACMFQIFNIPFTYTIESSIGSFYDSQKMKTFSFDIQNWVKMGKSICEGTSMFIEAYEQYEKFIQEKRFLRQKKKTDRLLISRKSGNRNNGKTFLEQQQEQKRQQQCKQPLKIRYRDMEQGLFMKIMKQIKKSEESVKKINIGQLDKQEQDLSSDDHDDNQDLQISKMKQLNNLITDCGGTKKERKNTKQQDNTFVRSKNLQITIKFSRQSQENEEDQMNFLQENILRKIKSSHSNQRPRFSPNKIRSETQKTKRQVNKTNTVNQQCLNQGNIIFTAQKDIDLQSSLRKSLNRKQNTTSRSYRTKSNNTYQINYHKNDHTMTRFSQIHFPHQDNHQQVHNSAKNSKNDLFKRVRRVRNSRQTPVKNITDLSHTQNVIKKAEISDQLRRKQIKTKNIEFSIQQLMNNLENRSKALKDSVKFKQNSKLKSKNNFIFPSSFHGIQNQVNHRRQFKTRQQTPISTQKPKRTSLECVPFQIKQYIKIATRK